MAKTSLFKRAEAGQTLSDGAFRAVRDQLRFELVDLQQRCRLNGAYPVIIVLSGVQGAGVVDSANLLNTWMDPRWIRTHAFDTPSDEERERPLFWRAWRSLPAAGTIGLYLDGWYGEAVTAHARGRTSPAVFADHLARIKIFERALTDDGALIVKIWLHLSQKGHRQCADAHHDDPVFGFRASDDSWPQPASYPKFTAIAAKGIKATDTTEAPWSIVDGTDDHHRRAQVLTILRDAMAAHEKAWLAKSKAAKKSIKRAIKADNKNPLPKKKKIGALAKVDLSKTLGDDAYAKAFHTRQARIYDLQKKARAAGLSTIIAFEGWDAAGKGGAIRRLTYALSARNYKVVPISAPSDEERAHHYLWRFWRHLSRDGHITLFDRSWYGRVLVERVEHLTAENAWTRAYDEINAFEAELAAHGTLLLKFWLHIDNDEQLRRFKEREKTAYKRWKITDDDWRNREKWNRSWVAVDEMLARTSTPTAPWHVIPANDKSFARIKIFDIAIKALETALKGRKA